MSGAVATTAHLRGLPGKCRCRDAGLVATVTLFAGLARWRSLHAPLELTVLGVAGSFLPFVPQVRLDPELVLVGLLPPLLYAKAIRSWT